jgi:hypothetical protein
VASATLGQLSRRAATSALPSTSQDSIAPTVVTSSGSTSGRYSAPSLNKILEDGPGRQRRLTTAHCAGSIYSNLSYLNKLIYKIVCEKPGMSWIIAIAFFGFLHWRMRRALEHAAERKASGMLRSPLHWASNALVLLLSALMLYIGYIHQQAPVPTVFFFAAFAIMVALLLLRRALKWRYPI